MSIVFWRINWSRTAIVPTAQPPLLWTVWIFQLVLNAWKSLTDHQARKYPEGGSFVAKWLILVTQKPQSWTVALSTAWNLKIYDANFVANLPQQNTLLVILFHKILFFFVTTQKRKTLPHFRCKNKYFHLQHSDLLHYFFCRNLKFNRKRRTWNKLASSQVVQIVQQEKFEKSESQW